MKGVVFAAAVAVGSLVGLGLGAVTKPQPEFGGIPTNSGIWLHMIQHTVGGTAAGVVVGGIAAALTGRRAG